MSRKRLDLEQTFQLVTECRKSGMSDQKWCLNHGITTANFYYKVRVLRENGYEIPDPPMRTSKSYSFPKKQDVVRVSVIPEDKEQFLKETLPVSSIKNTYSQTPASKDSAPIEILFQGIQIRINNDVHPSLLAHTLRAVKELSC